MKNIVILGSTGQIGQKALAVVDDHPDQFKVIGLACNQNSQLFQEQVKKYRPQLTSISALNGEEKMIELVTNTEVDLVIVAVVGIAGLVPTIEAIKAHKQIGLATKEVLVIAGELVMKLAKKHQVSVIPIDSEHSAIFQSIGSNNPQQIHNIYLTMGKGKIAQMSNQDLESVTLTDIYNRPEWSMGQKIAIDSASCINKTFEVIEAAHLFGLKPAQIQVVVHPEYFAHSLVQFIDGSIIGEFGKPDMYRYLSVAMSHPDRLISPVTYLSDLIDKNLSFQKAPNEKFPCLNLGYDALTAGGSMSAVLHGADKSVVDSFVAGKIKFTQFYSIIKSVMDAHQVISNPSLTELISIEKWAQHEATTIINNLKN